MTQRTVNRFAIVLVALVSYWSLMFYTTHMPAAIVESFDLSDKFLHLAAYSVLSFLLAAALHCRNWTFLAIVPVVVVTIAIYGFIDEATQPWFGRVQDTLDWLADMAGGIVGLILFLLARATIRAIARLLAPQRVAEVG